MSTASEPVVTRVEETASGYIGATILFAAVELGLFDALDAPATVSDLATKLAVTPDGLRRLCRVLAAMGLLGMAKDRVEPIAAAREALCEGGPAWSLVRHHARQVMPLFLRLPEAVRTGETQHAAWPFARSPGRGSAYDELARHPAELATFLEAMERSSRGVGTALAPMLRERGVRRLVDLGCGGGNIAREILAAMPDVEVESFDLEPACALARERTVAAGLGDRHRVAAGDLFTGVGARDADAVLLAGILADWSEPERARILATAGASLRRGGHLFISETLLDDDRAGPMGPAILSLVMLLAMRGDQLSGAELEGELTRAGYVDVRVIRGQPRDVVVATKA